MTRAFLRFKLAQLIEKLYKTQADSKFKQIIVILWYSISGDNAYTNLMHPTHVPASSEYIL